MFGGGTEEVTFYQTGCFRILADWLALVLAGPDADCGELAMRACDISPDLAEYLELTRFRDVWPKLQKNNRGQKARQAAFNCWFDGLKTLRLIHHLSALSYPRCQPEETLPDLLQWGGLGAVSGVVQSLELVRRHQLGSDVSLSPPPYQ
jgi:hypothetical protein